MANLRDIRPANRLKYPTDNPRHATGLLFKDEACPRRRSCWSSLRFHSRPMLHTVSRALQTSGADIEHPFFEKRSVKRRGILLLSTDKGLCGPLNTNLFRLISEQVQGEASFFTVGKKGAQYVAREGLDQAGAYEISDKAESKEVVPLVDSAIAAYKAGHIDTLEIAYPSFVNVLARARLVAHPSHSRFGVDVGGIKEKIKGDAELEIDESRRSLSSHRQQKYWLACPNAMSNS